MAVTPNPLTALDVMRDAPVIPVIVLDEVAQAVPLARALVAGGIRMLEVTLRTSAALACIQAIARAQLPTVTVGEILLVLWRPALRLRARLRWGISGRSCAW